MPTETLDSFEAKLLTELRGVVRESMEFARPAGTRRVWAAAAAAVVAGGAAAIAVPLTSVGSPAFAIEKKADGDVVVTIDRLEDAAALQQALAAHGLPARVSYHGGLFDPRTLPPGPGLGDLSCGPADAPSIEPHDGTVTVIIPAPTVAAVSAGQTLVIKIDTLDPEAGESGAVDSGRMVAAVGNDQTGCAVDETGAWYSWQPLSR
jgi:hypothetical protein